MVLPTFFIIASKQAITMSFCCSYSVLDASFARVLFKPLTVLPLKYTVPKNIIRPKLQIYYWSFHPGEFSIRHLKEPFVLPSLSFSYFVGKMKDFSFKSNFLKSFIKVKISGFNDSLGNWLLRQQCSNYK